MNSHFETYKGWSIAVEISAHLSRIDVDQKIPEYMPRVVVTRHEGVKEFKDYEIADGHSYPTTEECIRHGVLTAHAYIDGRA